MAVFFISASLQQELLSILNGQRSRPQLVRQHELRPDPRPPLDLRKSEGRLDAADAGCKTIER